MDIRRSWLVALGGGVEGSFVLLAWLLGWLVGFPPFAQIHWHLTEAVYGFAACSPMVLGALALMRWPIGPLASIKRFSEEVIRPLFVRCTVLDLALISLLAGLGEELLFRGVLQPWFAHWMGAIPALLLASLLFGLVHPITTAYVVLAAVLGMYLGLLVVLTGNLLPAIIAHAVYDFLVLLYLVRRPAPSPPAACDLPGEAPT